MSVTRTPACTVRGCPAPRDPDWHVTICGHGLEGHHHHVIKRSQGGKDGPQVFICPNCHHNIDNGLWGNDIKDMPGRGRVYFAWDIHGNTLIEREVMPNDLRTPNSDQREVGRESGLVLSDGAESSRVASGTFTSSPRAQDGATSAPSLSTKEESDDTLHTLQVPDVHTTVPEVRAAPLTHEQRVAIAQAIKDTEWNRQWIAGDTGNLWIEQLGESAEQYLSDFGYQPESLANILRVCAAIPSTYRNGNLRFSHHVVVYDQPPEDRMRWLTECEANEWSVAEFRRQVKGTKPRVKRWSRDELKDKWDSFWFVRDYNDPKWDADSRINIAFVEFLDYLEEQA